MRRLAVVLAVLLTSLAVPAGASAAGMISSLSVNPSMVRDGASATATVTLAFPDPAPTTVLVFSSDPSVASVPATVIVPAGAVSADFTIATNAAAPEEIVQIMAAVGNVPRTANLSVNAATPGGGQLSAVSVTPASVVGGGGATGTVRFSRAPDGAIVQLSSSNPAIVGVPAETVVPGGSATGAFAVTTRAVTAATTVTITARWFGITKTTTITVTPGAPPVADTVRITKATWKKGLLTIEATSTNPNAILSVFSRSDSFMFTLTNKDGGKFADQRGFITNPERITVRSNFGGSASANLGS
jgi:hypothetical protein